MNGLRFISIQSDSITRAARSVAPMTAKTPLRNCANDVAPICPVISLHSRGNQYNDAFRLSNCFALLARVAHAGINAPQKMTKCDCASFHVNGLTTARDRPARISNRSEVRRRSRDREGSSGPGTVDRGPKMIPATRLACEARGGWGRGRGSFSLCFRAIATVRSLSRSLSRRSPRKCERLRPRVQYVPHHASRRGVTGHLDPQTLFAEPHKFVCEVFY